MTATLPEIDHGSPTALPSSMLDRMTLIMECFSALPARLTLEDIVTATQLPRSTTHRILVDLVRLGWLQRTPDGYGMGRRPLAFQDDSGQARLRETTAETLHELALRTGMVVHLAVLEESEIVYLDKVGGRFATRVPSRVGGRAAAHSTALGKSMLAWLSPEEVDGQMQGALGRVTSRTIGSLATLHQELARIRNRMGGLAYERGECVPDVACVASAIRSPDGPVASISLCGDSRAQLERVAPLVARAARSASNELFPRRKTARRRPAVESVPDGRSAQPMGTLTTVGRGADWI